MNAVWGQGAGQTPTRTGLCGLTCPHREPIPTRYRPLAVGSMMVFDEPSGLDCIPGGV
jgi:hypothetical protein